MRHLTDTGRHTLAPLLEQLRAVPGLAEPRPASFTFRRQGILHFHEDGDDFFADVKLDGTTYERWRVTTRTEQARLVRAVRRCCAGAGAQPGPR